MKKIIWLIVLLVAAKAVLAEDFFLINQPLPQGIQQQPGEGLLPDNVSTYKTPLGVISKCYHGGHYLVLSENELGKGYEFTQSPPAEASCVQIGENIALKNQAGIFLGMPKKQVLTMLSVPGNTNKATLLFNAEKMIVNKRYDEQTWVDIEFVEDKLIRFSIFTSLTN